MRGLSIGIVGCGTAGPAAALLLASGGHEVTLFERVPLPGPVGAGIVLQPSGLAVMARLGLASHVLDAGARLVGLSCNTSLGLSLMKLRYARLAPDLFGLGLHRGVLFQSLYGALEGSGVALALGRSAFRLEASGDRHAIRFEDGGRSDHFDLVVVADGARSQLRDATFPHANVRTYRWGCLWFVAPVEGPVPNELVQVVRGTHEMIGLLPTGHGPEASLGPMLSLFYSVEASAVDELRSTSLEAWRALVRRRIPRATRVVDQITSWEQLLFARYHDVVMPTWHDRGVVVIGDAAHATSPQLGQGCNLALVDAAALADAIASSDALPTALASYERARRPSLGFYQRATRWLTPLFQSGEPGYGLLRDLTFPILSRAPYFERRMLESMAGASTGLF